MNEIVHFQDNLMDDEILMFDRFFVQKSCKKPNFVNFLDYIYCLTWTNLT